MDKQAMEVSDQEQKDLERVGVLCRAEIAPGISDEGNSSRRAASGYQTEKAEE